MKSKILYTILIGAAVQLATSARATLLTQIDLYETTDNSASGTAAETGPWVNIGVSPIGVTWVVINENGDNGHGVPHWSDILEFNGNDQVRLLSRLTNGDVNPNWPAESDVEPHPIIINEDANGIAIYDIFGVQPETPASQSTGVELVVHSDDPANDPPGNGGNPGVPDGGATVYLLGAALSGLGFFTRRVKARK